MLSFHGQICRAMSQLAIGALQLEQQMIPFVLRLLIQEENSGIKKDEGSIWKINRGGISFPRQKDMLML